MLTGIHLARYDCKTAAVKSSTRGESVRCFRDRWGLPYADCWQLGERLHCRRSFALQPYSYLRKVGFVDSTLGGGLPLVRHPWCGDFFLSITTREVVV
jgi:hypothetical protein